MGLGQGSITVNQRKEPAGAPAPPFSLNSADNGVSVDPITGRIVLGDDNNLAGAPGTLLSNRFLNLDVFNFEIDMVGGAPAFLIDSINKIYSIGDTLAFGNNTSMTLDDNNQTISLTAGFFQYGLFDAVTLGGFISLNTPTSPALQASGFGTTLLSPSFQIALSEAANNIATLGFAELIGTTGTSYTNNAAAAVGTLLNAPVAGNPTKWIPINDNGVIRSIPAW